MKKDLCELVNILMANYSIETPIEQLWCVFRDKLLLVLENYVPMKTPKRNLKNPWINHSIKQLS